MPNKNRIRTWVESQLLRRRDFLRLSLAGLTVLGGCSANGARQSGGDNLPLTRLAFGSCVTQEEPQPIWDTIAAANPNMFVFIGDNIYADTEDMALMKQRYEMLGAKPQFAAFRQHFPVYATWDDHDFGINDGGREYPKKDESKQLMLDFFGEPADSARRRRQGVYTSYSFGPAGQDVQLILMDLRYFRSPLIFNEAMDGYVPNPDPAATMLGDEQWLWLEGELKKPARIRVIASSSQLVAEGHKAEKWANFPLEKARLLAMIDRLQIRNAVVISGDMHYAELSAERTAGGFTLFDLTSSGMNFYESAQDYPNTNRLSLNDSCRNFGVVEFDWLPNSVVVSLQVRNDAGDTVIRKDVSL